MNEAIKIVKKLEGEKRWLYCKFCKTFPDNIKGYVNKVEYRKWDGEEYEFEKEDWLEHCRYECEDCNTRLEEVD